MLQLNERYPGWSRVQSLMGVLLVAGLAMSLTVLSACSKKEKALEEIRRLFEAGEFDETIANCRHAIRRDIKDADVYYYYGLSLIELGRDYEAFKQLDTSTELNSSLSSQIAKDIFAAAKNDFDTGRLQRAGRRFEAVMKYDASFDLAAYRFIAGDVFFDAKDFPAAIEMYDIAVKDFADSSIVERTLYRLSIAYQAVGAEDSSKVSLQRLLERYPRGEYATEASWRLADLLYDMGERELANGNFEAVIEVTDELLELTNNSTLAQKGHFIRGEAYEGLGEFKKAYQEYRAVIEQDRGASGRIVQRAEAKIAVLLEAGLH